jgi:hypothetical protein
MLNNLFAIEPNFCVVAERIKNCVRISHGSAARENAKRDPMDCICFKPSWCQLPSIPLASALMRATICKLSATKDANMCLKICVRGGERPVRRVSVCALGAPSLAHTIHEFQWHGHKFDVLIFQRA